jgi:hypothetical protein
MATNKLISALVASQLPQFVRDDHQTFTSFVEAYFEYLEQSNTTLQFGKTIERAKNLINYRDVDKTLTDFSAHLYSQFLNDIPKNSLASHDLIIKHVKDFYRAKGTEKATKFLLRILTAKESNFYYPKLDILRVSDGKWYVQKTLRVRDIAVDGEANTSLAAVKLFNARQVMGMDSEASAIVDAAEQFYNEGILINELTLSGIEGTFSSSEEIHATYLRANGATGNLTATLFSGQISSVRIIDGGAGYSVGNQAIIESSTGSGGIIEVSEVSDGNVLNISVFAGGAGFRVGDFILMSGGGGTGANANVSIIDESGNVHSNTYNVITDIINLEANTPINNTIYTNLVSANANTALGNSFHRFLFTNTGPALIITVNNPGTGYSAVPVMDIIANTRIKVLGILGRMEIANAGSSYSVGDKIEFINVIGGHGQGASANVTAVNGSGGVTEVRFVDVPGWLPGGSGYSQALLPKANIISTTGSGANVVVTAVLGDGETLKATAGTLGSILQMIIIAGGSGYTEPPTINLTTQGTGTANVLANVIQGLFSYHGRYINDDGQLSAYNFLQDRDYYQNHSYVVRIAEALDSYKNALLSLLHPAGLKLFAEYLLERIPRLSELLVGESEIREETLFTAQAVRFNGASYFRRTAGGLNNVADTRVGTFSIWLDPYTLPSNGNSIVFLSVGRGSNQNIIFSIVNNYIQNANSGTGVYFDLRLGDSTNASAIHIRSDANSHPITNSGWVHLLATWNTADRDQTRLLIDNVNSTIIVANNSNNVVWNIPNVTIGADPEGSRIYDGCFSELLLTDSWIDLSVAANTTLFAANWLPVPLDLTLTGYNKQLYFKDDASSVQTNSGLAGSFPVKVGGFTDCINGPSDNDFFHVPAGVVDATPEPSLDFSFEDNSMYLGII